MISKQEQDATKIIPNEVYVSVDHDSKKLWYPDYECVYWYRADEYDDGDSVEEHLQYFGKNRIKSACPIPSDKTWHKFIRRLKEIDTYSLGIENIPVVEGITDTSPETWEVRIIFQDRSIFEAAGPIEKIPPHFDEFCEAVSELIDRPFGEKFQKGVQFDTG